MLGLVISLMMLASTSPSVLTVDLTTVPIDTNITKEWTIEEMKTLAEEKARKYGLHVYRFKKTIECESRWDRFAQGDFRNGKPTSFGLAQFHYPTRDWDMATSSAYEPEVALEVMALAWSRDEAFRWSCWQRMFGR
jgi:hypothetical protein